jgi:C1A family cysteine protease
MKFTIALLATASASDLMTNADYQFMKFVTQQGRSFGTKSEFEFRSQIFKNRLAEIEEHNSKGLSWKLGVNHLSDRTEDEIKKLLGYVPMTEDQKNYAVITTDSDPVDWRDKNAVTEVKEQKDCASGWAFSATGAMEGAHAIKTGKLVSLSEQNLLDCSIHNGGCNGGTMDKAFLYAEKYRLESESDYPYEAHAYYDCHYRADWGKVGTYRYWDVMPRSISAMKSALAKGPVSAPIQASRSVFNHYSSGIIKGNDCGTYLDHGILVVGWGTSDEDGTEYYIVKNSWGSSWGENGYARLAIEEGNGVCGIQMNASFPETD